jgi:transposase
MIFESWVCAGVPMNRELRVAVDVGCHGHRVAVGLSDGGLIDEFDITHDAAGLSLFFQRVGRHEREHGLPVAVAMEGYNGYARPLDRQVLGRGYRLYNVNNLKLARYKEIFPAPAKTDAIDARRMLELFQFKDRVPQAREVLQEVGAVPIEHEQLKALTRRRKQLVAERMRAGNRLQANLQAISPGLLDLTGEADNLWFLTLLSCRDDLAKLKGLRLSSLLALKGVGKLYASKVRAWQPTATFSEAVAWMGPMVISDARRMLELRAQVKTLQLQIQSLCQSSRTACQLQTIPGFGTVTAGEITGELGAIERFESEASLAMYAGMAPLDNSSGKRIASKSPRQVNARARAAMMIVVARHIGCVAQSRAFYDKKRLQGKSHNQALRALGRHLIRVIWSMLQHNRDYQVRESLKNT